MLRPLLHHLRRTFEISGIHSSPPILSGEYEFHPYHKLLGYTAAKWQNPSSGPAQTDRDPQMLSCFSDGGTLMISCILMSLVSFAAFWGQIIPSSFALLLQLGSFSISFNELLGLGNYASVLFFGIVTALYLADIPFQKHKRLYLFTLLGFSGAQLVFYLLLGMDRLYRCYPFLIHLPLILLIHFMLHRNLYISIIAVLTAYLLCTPRKWAGTLAASFFGYDPVVSNIVTILVTLPMLYLVIRFISPYVVRLKYESKTILSFFFLLPLSYYILEYAFTVYTDLLYTGGPAVIDFMDTFIVHALLHPLHPDLKLFRSDQKGLNMKTFC